MKTWQKIGVGLIVTLLILFGFLSWYRYTYSMDYVESFEVNSSQLSKKVLIATQGSTYKDEILNKIISDYPAEEVYFKIIDVSHLSEVKVEAWSAILIFHTWENWKPPLNVQTFIDDKYDADKMIVLTTSGAGDFKMEGIDAIIGESLLAEVDEKAWHIKQRLDQILE